MADYISREAAIDAIWKPEVRPNDLIFDALRRACEEEVKHIPAADVVARDCYDRILSENDTMREQLAQIGKKPGDKMEDVRTVVRGKWEIDNSYPGPGLMNVKCSACGADMEGNENG